jgi:hypothetical protein
MPRQISFAMRRTLESTMAHLAWSGEQVALGFTMFRDAAAGCLSPVGVLELRYYVQDMREQLNAARDIAAEYQEPDEVDYFTYQIRHLDYIETHLMRRFAMTQEL